MSLLRRTLFSIGASCCFIVCMAGMIYAMDSDIALAGADPNVTKDWLIGIMVAVIGFLVGLGLNELLKRNARMERKLSKVDVRTKLMAQFIGMDLKNEDDD